MYLRASIVAATLFSPALALAANASFPAQSLWLSTTNPSVGDKVRIYTVVYNGSDEVVEGDVTFLVDNKTNDSVGMSLKSGESKVASTLWTASEGEHTFSARFGIVGSPESEAILSASVSAAVAAPPSQVEQTITQAKEVGTQLASTSIPIVSAVAEKVFDTTEAIRNAGIEYFESKQAANAPSKVTTASSSSNVEGFEAPAASSSEKDSILGSAGQVASAAALFTFRSMWLFYPLLVILLLLIFRSLYRWATRPRF